MYPHHKAALRGDLGPLRPAAPAAQRATTSVTPHLFSPPSPSLSSLIRAPLEAGAHHQAALGAPRPALSNCPPLPYSPESPSLGSAPGVPGGQQGASLEWGVIWSMTFVQLPASATRPLVAPPFGSISSSGGSGSGAGAGAAVEALGVPAGDHRAPALGAICQTVELAVLVQRCVI